MLALSQPKSLDGCNALPSILDLTAKSACPGRDPPDGLTAGRRRLAHRALRVGPEAKGDGERTDITIRMADILVNANKPPK